MAENIKDKIEKLISNIASKTNHIDKFASNLQKADINLNDAKVSLENSATGFSGKADDLAKTLKDIKSLNESIENLINEIGSVDFPQRLDSIEKTVQETISQLTDIRQSTIDEVQKASKSITKADFEGKFRKLQDSVDSSITANMKVKDSIVGMDLGGKVQRGQQEVSLLLQKELQELESSTNTTLTENKKFTKEELTRIESSVNLSLAENRKFIQDLNLSIRMDKLDANIAGIMAGIQNTQSRFDTLERTLTEKIKETGEKQSQALQNITNLDRDLKNLIKKQHTNTWITWVLMAIGGLILAYLAMKY